MTVIPHHNSVFFDTTHSPLTPEMDGPKGVKFGTVQITTGRLPSKVAPDGPNKKVSALSAKVWNCPPPLLSMQSLPPTFLNLVCWLVMNHSLALLARASGERSSRPIRCGLPAAHRHVFFAAAATAKFREGVFLAHGLGPCLHGCGHHVSGQHPRIRVSLSA